MTADLEPAELRARIGEAQEVGSDATVSLTVDHIRLKEPANRLEFLRAVYEGESELSIANYNRMFGSGGKRERWCTARTSPWGANGEAGPLVGASIGAPPARFNRIGAPHLDWAAMRFIVAAHENFAFLLELAEEGLAARQAKTEEQA